MITGTENRPSEKVTVKCEACGGDLQRFPTTDSHVEVIGHKPSDCLLTLKNRLLATNDRQRRVVNVLDLLLSMKAPEGHRGLRIIELVDELRVEVQAEAVASGTR